jgi:hypothetical protein
VLLENIPAPDRGIEAAFTVFSDSVCVMQFVRSINAQAYKIIVTLEKRRPLVVDQRAVGLDRVLDALVRPAVQVCQVH